MEVGKTHILPKHERGFAPDSEGRNGNTGKDVQQEANTDGGV
jgi:hypothetical protein